MLHNILKWTFIIRENKTSYLFNIYNPIAWLVLFIVAFFAGIYQGYKSMIKIVVEVVSDAKEQPETDAPSGGVWVGEGGKVVPNERSKPLGPQPRTVREGKTA